MASNTGTPAASWHVTSSQEQTLLNDAGQVVPSMVVAFQTGAGQSGTITLPRTAYTVDNVRKAVQAQADLLDTVVNLTSE